MKVECTMTSTATSTVALSTLCWWWGTDLRVVKTTGWSRTVGAEAGVTRGTSRWQETTTTCATLPPGPAILLFKMFCTTEQ